MPQLNPVPWFCYFLMTWLILMSLAPRKILAHINLNNFNVGKPKMLHSQIWAWSW
uniref:ATP synthase F0 subunit 8 n=1 Tax=Odorrana hosii TaxID=310666 RepID=UPI00226CBADB|nr:ATP synthase F0 subunit 8 [Odorrana hosii]UZC57598.1 ATP synthase F0 subunit 8 [Odorrana hosii]